MKKTLITYLVIPGILLAVFIFFYVGAVKDMEHRAAEKQAEKVRVEAVEKARKDEIEKKAIADAEKRQREREEADRAKEAKKEAAYQEVMTQLATETTKWNTQADKLAKEVGTLEISISQARSNKEKLTRETFDLSKEVELAKINRRNAELEIQRMVEIAAKKMMESSVAIAPPPPPPPAAK
jgi:hypothetical protein